MAYSRDRAPLLDTRTQAALERRGRELLGLGLLGLGLLAAVMLATYSPDDPNWMTAGGEAPRNWLGTFGASLAHPLVTVTGRAAWAVPLVLMVWGARLALHRAEERARALLAPIFVAVLAVALAAWEPPASWAHAFGLGGMFGDTGLGLLLTVLPFGDGVLAVLAGAGALALGAWVLGVTGPELREARRLGTLGLVLGYDCALRWGAAGAVLLREALEAGRARGVQAWEARRERLAEAREALLAEERALRAVPDRPEGGTAPAMGRPRAAIVRAEAPVRAMPPAVVPALGATLDDVADRRADPAPEDDGPWTFEGDWEDAEDEPAHLPFGATPADMPPADLASDDSTFADPLPPALVAPLRADHVPAPPARGFLHALLRRARGEPDEAPAASGEPATDGDRIRARIGDAIRARTAGPELRAMPPSALGAVLAGGPTLLPVPVPTLPVVAAPSVAEAPAPVAPLAAPPRPAPAAQPAPRPAAPRPVAPRPAPTAPHYETPPLDLLADPAAVRRHHLPDEALATNARLLESVLDDYGVKGEIAAVRPGPVVTMYELEPAPGLKASRVIGLSDDIARSMEALSARVSTVPGRSVIGIELPNQDRERVVLREIIAAPEFTDPGMRLPLALGKDIGGAPVIANLAKMPHLLIAGTTGSGKSVAINTMILSLLYKLTPEECRLIMIDPKMLELSVYDGIPHLLSPVVTDPKKAVTALKWVVGEMEERYRKMSKMGVRNIEGYNGRVREALANGETFSRVIQTGFDDETGDPVFETDEIVPEVIPFIVVVVDEMADLMMVAGKEIEACIQRLAQMARASGIHLIMATQRPSVDVITGTIKANFPTRISFQVTSKIDSRTILGEQGAEQLLGQGDMLYMAGGGRITRIHGPFCSDEEVEEIVTFLKGFGPPAYVGAVLEDPPEPGESADVEVTGSETEDALYDMAVQIVARDRKCSTSYIQRKLAIGYNKAARLVEQMETEGVVTPANHVGKREILVPEAQ